MPKIDELLLRKIDDCKLLLTLIYHENYRTINQAELSIFEYIEIWYNKQRIHSALGYLTPYEYEMKYYQGCPAHSS